MTAKESITVSAPSNIALIKYWGKQDTQTQWPCNDSLSMTLSQARTFTKARLTNNTSHEVYISGQQLFETDVFAKKIYAHIKFLAKECEQRSKVRIDTRNTFPDSCGIASSASGFAALTIAAIAAWTSSKNFGELAACGYTLEKLAHLSRIGSGSACRSLHSGFVHWVASEAPSLQHVKSIYPDSHWNLCDLIVIVSPKKKSTSSSIGHQSAQSSPFFTTRVASIPERIRKVKQAIANKNLDDLGTIIETDAMEMHSIMATSKPSTVYINNDTTKLINWIKQQRETSGLRCYFTIDAGPNVHVLCESADQNDIATRIAAAFPNFEILLDKIGDGPRFESELKT